MEKEDKTLKRRDFLSWVAMGAGLALGYGLLGLQGLSFILPKRIRPKTRLLFVGTTDNFPLGTVKEFLDLQGDKILIKRDESGVNAFSSRCPHLGCKVHWEKENKRFFCPCHNGAFDTNGVATSGPPAADSQRLATVPIVVEKPSGVIYLEVRDVSKKA